MPIATFRSVARVLVTCAVLATGATAALISRAAADDDDVTLPYCAALPLPHGTIAADGSACRPLDVKTPNGTIHLAIAATEPQREHGLMGVAEVPYHQGMLFAFPDGKNAQRDFWMKNTITPLDMVFITDGGAITAIAANVPATAPNTPDDKVARRSGVGRYVIELGAGEAARLGLAPKVRIPIPPIPAE
jgi:uncharacterized membrane protein (UPF0127 family)